jgi:hypothetical protein
VIFYFKPTAFTGHFLAFRPITTASLSFLSYRKNRIIAGGFVLKRLPTPTHTACFGALHIGTLQAPLNEAQRLPTIRFASSSAILPFAVRHNNTCSSKRTPLVSAIESIGTDTKPPKDQYQPQIAFPLDLRPVRLPLLNHQIISCWTAR